MTLTVDCPWCDVPVGVHDDDDVIACEACGVVADLAPDAPMPLADAA
jgi:primosomal protein N'